MWTWLKACIDHIRSRGSPPRQWRDLNLSAYAWHRASPMLRALFGYWFVDSFAGERTFGRATSKHVSQLYRRERELLLSLVRPRIELKYVHILDAVAALDDRESIPELRHLLRAERDLSRRLSLARTLWELDRDSEFYNLLVEMTRAKQSALREAHTDDVLRLGDERTIDLLLILLRDRSEFVRFLACGYLNEVEVGHSIPPLEKQRRPASYYAEALADPGYRTRMIENLQKMVAKGFPDETV